jgi:hypothetical protein
MFLRFLRYRWTKYIFCVIKINLMHHLISVYCQSTSTCSGHFCSPSSGGILYIYSSWYVLCSSGQHSQLKSTTHTDCCIYRVSQEECARLREGVPYVKVHRYNPKHLCPKLNGYVDNGQRKVWSSGGYTHCTCQLTVLSMSVRECGVI